MSGWLWAFWACCTFTLLYYYQFALCEKTVRMVQRVLVPSDCCGFTTTNTQKYSTTAFNTHKHRHTRMVHRREIFPPQATAIQREEDRQWDELQRKTEISVLPMPTSDCYNNFCLDNINMQHATCCSDVEIQRICSINVFSCRMEEPTDWQPLNTACDKVGRLLQQIRSIVFATLTFTTQC